MKLYIFAQEGRARARTYVLLKSNTYYIPACEMNMTLCGYIIITIN